MRSAHSSCGTCEFYNCALLKERPSNPFSYLWLKICTILAKLLSLLAMGCTSSQTSEQRRCIVELPDGCIASDLKVRVSQHGVGTNSGRLVHTKADGHHINPLAAQHFHC
eukprot:1649766-Amphidinium_carterae.2